METISPIIITKTIRLESPAIARIPKTESIHKSSNIEAIA